MDHKPWKANGPHRGSFGSDRRERDRFSDRREDRFSDRRENRFSDRHEGRFSDRREGRFSDRRQGGGPRARTGERRPFAPRAEAFGVRSGPRARALESRRFSERSDFEKNAVVRLAPDVAPFFESADAVNAALRQLIAAADLLKKADAKPVEAAPAVTEEEAGKLFADADREDDVEETAYGEGEERIRETSDNGA